MINLNFLSTAKIVDEGDSIVVETHWTQPIVDRPYTGGTSCGRDLKLAERLAKCINDGKCHRNPEVKTDVNGKTYVEASCLVMGRRLNADLKRLGY